MLRLGSRRRGLQLVDPCGLFLPIPAVIVPIIKLIDKLFDKPGPHLACRGLGSPNVGDGRHRRLEQALHLHEGPHRPQESLVPQKQSSHFTLGPELDRIADDFHRIRVSSYEKTAKEDPTKTVALGVQVGELANVVTYHPAKAHGDVGLAVVVQRLVLVEDLAKRRRDGVRGEPDRGVVSAPVDVAD